MTHHTVPSTTDTVRSGYLDATAPPVASIVSGDSITFPDTWTHWGNEAVYGMTFAEREPLRHRYPNGPYSMLGPVEIIGAEPGDIVECTIEHLRPISWGWNSFPLGVGALPDDFDTPYVHYFRFSEDHTRTDFVHGISFDLSPFVGVIGTEPAGMDRVSAIVSGAYGGNLVLNDLVAGSSVFLPVQKPGARIWFGDIHARQGDGVVDQTGIETAAESIRLRYDLHRGVELDGPIIDNGVEWIGLGFAETLDQAVVNCLRSLIDLLHRATGLSRSDAYALCSLAVSFRITQFANQTHSAYTATPPRAVHGKIPKTIFPRPLADKFDAWLRRGPNETDIESEGPQHQGSLE